MFVQATAETDDCKLFAYCNSWRWDCWIFACV